MKFLIGFIVGELVGVFLMCILQVGGKDEK